MDDVIVGLNARTYTHRHVGPACRVFTGSFVHLSPGGAVNGQCNSCIYYSELLVVCYMSLFFLYIYMHLFTNFSVIFHGILIFFY